MKSDSGYNDNYLVFRNMVFQITLNQVKSSCGFWCVVGMVNITINITVAWTQKQELSFGLNDITDTH